MASSNILGGNNAPAQPRGTGTGALGPSDSSDSGSDVQGERRMATGPDEPDEMGAVPADLDSDSDSGGTGERASAVSEDGPDAPDIMPDRIIRSSRRTFGDASVDDVVDRAAESADPADPEDAASEGDDEGADESPDEVPRRPDGTPRP